MKKGCNAYTIEYYQNGEYEEVQKYVVLARSKEEAYKEIVAGNKDAIADIGGRFPIATTALGMIGENAGASMVFGALDFVTVRKVEANLKEGVKPIEDDPKPEKEAKKAEAGDKPKGKRGRKPKQKVEEVPEEKEVMNKPEEADEPDYDSMSEVELFKVCKAKGLKPAPKRRSRRSRR